MTFFPLAFYFFIFALLVLKIKCAFFFAALNLLINIDFVTCYAIFFNSMRRIFVALLTLKAGLNLLIKNNTY